ncbi:MAG: efflux RND transporter periplasmic adaptor subunit [Bacteroidales bacterium]|nr:efflux RND transporter periplasmic adaptor subunit [Bacilli bacterium]MDD2576877.1 efflux RND transporter periplasmic adaptor subunit [Bacteroidales bacterium]MDD4739535.1 efflux RND transporter periplasmic adaptor subunit [Bacteroidales bacterium]
MTKNKFISSSIILALFISLVSCSGGKKVDEAKEVEILPENIVEMRDDQIKLADIQMGTIEYRSISGTLKVSGLIGVAPQNLATVCMPMGGFVKSTKLMPGNTVKKGQTLAVLENPEFVDIQRDYLEAKSKLKFAKAEYDRQEELYKNGISSQKNMQQVTSDYKSLKVQVNALEQKLSLIGINPLKLNEDNISRSIALVSPISGYVKTANISIGKSVSPSDILFEIINTDKLFLELNLFEKDADQVSNGQKIHFFINGEREEHEASIYQIGRSVNADKTYKVYANVSSYCKNLLPGMYVNAKIDASTNEVTALPTEAIVSFDDKDYIFIFEKNKKEDGKPFTEYQMVQIHKGVSDSGYTEITLPEGFDIKKIKVVIKGAYNLLSAKKNAGEMSC